MWPWNPEVLSTALCNRNHNTMYVSVHDVYCTPGINLFLPREAMKIVEGTAMTTSHSCITAVRLCVGVQIWGSCRPKYESLFCLITAICMTITMALMRLPLRRSCLTPYSTLQHAEVRIFIWFTFEKNYVLEVSAKVLS